MKGRKHSRDEIPASDDETERISQRSSVLRSRREQSLILPTLEDDGKDPNQPLSSLKEQFDKEPSIEDVLSDSEDADKKSEVNVEERSVCIIFDDIIKADLISSFRRIRNSQLCEHIYDNMWPRAAKFARILNPEATTGDSKFLIPGMLKPVYHWQWLCIFVVVRFNRGSLGRYGALVGDEMGLGKVMSTVFL